ncbi:periplasmic protein [Campylobacter insulaenigrae]|uniref:PepSY-like domain-containing protein n=1 Tax=Campylobacter insulaenigrae TaxID=260714 RepID=UPI000F6FBAB3|nr:PepSY-like domain-containing protein [Campylobacter insulaenigrae]MCR6590648.1 PepSY-like domain-containing protein [Campylobacter insulaenigrae]MCR6592185.1 PepSY-like domain-containing protein [Campylobacter insulaenigrae]VEJ53666.1 periplasmic protein [Campylobacter insulaenigrae]
MKVKLILSALMLASVIFAKDMIVGKNALPENSKSFIKQYFSNANITLVKQDIDSFDVYLDNGTELEFFSNGDWKEIDSKYNPMNTSFLNQNILKTIKKMHPNANIIKAEKEVQGFKFKLNNMMEIYIDANGNFLGQKLDD